MKNCDIQTLTICRISTDYSTDSKKSFIFLVARRFSMEMRGDFFSFPWELRMGCFFQKNCGKMQKLLSYYFWRCQKNKRISNREIQRLHIVNHWIKSSKQVLLQKENVKWKNSLILSELKIHLIDDEIYLYLFLQISIQQLSKLWNWCLTRNKQI